MLLTCVGFCALARLPKAILCPYSQCFVAGQHSAVGDLSGIHAQTILNRVLGTYGHQSIHAKTIIPFVFLEHWVTRASMPKPQVRSCS